MNILKDQTLALMIESPCLKYEIARELMQHHLHHGEFVQIRVEQACDDHGH